jgi:uncharacterized protein YigE (DUF2233 family)
LARPIAPGHSLAALPSAQVFSFALDDVRLTIEDLNGRSLESLRVERGASLVINAGFFDPDFAPEGLSVSEGRELSPLVPSLSGGVLTIDRHRARLFEAETFVRGPSPIEFAVQCRPRLVVDGRNNIASDNGVRAARTALCIRDDHRTLDVVIATALPELGVTLYELGAALVAHGCSDALNLDGGPSTGAAWRDVDGSQYVRPRGPVRQAILIRSAP